MTVPVYLFTGFLESGKTSLIKETLLDPGFNDGEKTLLLACEEGLEEYDDDFLNKTNTTIVTVEHEEALSYEFLKKCDSLIEPDRVMIEFNGTWNFNNFLDVEYPFDWLLVQILSTVDASTFQMYINNMRSMIYEQLVHSEVIIFNRCDENTKKLYLRNNVKAINQKAQLIYETKDGQIVDLKDDEMPFDLSADILKIENQDYGLWYMDCMEHPKKYDGKRIQISGKVIATHVENMDHAFVFGRYAMVCCADDTSLIGLLCHYQNSSELLPKEWVSVDADIRVEFDEEYGQEVPILYVRHVESIEPLKDELVYFT